MRIISSTKLRRKKEAFLIQKREYLDPDDDLNRAISIEEFKEGAIEHIKKLYRKDK